MILSLLSIEQKNACHTGNQHADQHRQDTLAAVIHHHAFPIEQTFYKDRIVQKNLDCHILSQQYRSTMIFFEWKTWLCFFQQINQQHSLHKIAYDIENVVHNISHCSLCLSQIIHIGSYKIVIFLFCQKHSIAIFQFNIGIVIADNFLQIHQKSPVRSEKMISQFLL